jgi:hypothetical protein
VYACLTDVGARLLEEAAPGHVALVRELVIDVLTLEQLSALADGLGEVSRRMLASRPDARRPDRHWVCAGGVVGDGHRDLIVAVCNGFERDERVFPGRHVPVLACRDAVTHTAEPCSEHQTDGEQEPGDGDLPPPRSELQHGHRGTLSPRRTDVNALVSLVVTSGFASLGEQRAFIP